MLYQVYQSALGCYIKCILGCYIKCISLHSARPACRLTSGQYRPQVPGAEHGIVTVLAQVSLS
jgi:hypothetical protein